MNFATFILCMVRLVFVACETERYGFYERSASFEGLSQEMKEHSKGRCAARSDQKIIIMVFLFLNDTKTEQP